MKLNEKVLFVLLISLLCLISNEAVGRETGRQPFSLDISYAGRIVEHLPLSFYIEEHQLSGQEADFLKYDNEIQPDAIKLERGGGTEFRIAGYFPELLDYLTENSSFRPLDFKLEFNDARLAAEGHIIGSEDIKLVILRMKNLASDVLEDRALTIGCRTGGYRENSSWWNDIRDEEEILYGQTYQNLLPAYAGKGLFSRYPIGAVTDSAIGLCLAAPIEPPLLSRTSYNGQHNALNIEFDVGISGRTEKFPDYAEIAFIIYTFDPEWGFRSALEKYYSLFPRAFDRRVTNEGQWMPFTQIDNVKRPEDFYFGFHEFHPDVDITYNNQNGIYSLIYCEPIVLWLNMPQDYPRDYDHFIKTMISGNNSLRSGLWTSAAYKADGTFDLTFADFPWAQGARLPVNSDFDVPVTKVNPVNAGMYGWQPYKDFTENMKDRGVCDGLYCDSFEGWEAANLNYRESHFQFADYPLVYNTDEKKLALWDIFTCYEFAEECRDRLRANDKFLMANTALYKFYWTTAYFDIMGIETNWGVREEIMAPPVQEMDFVRSMAFQKPYCYLQNVPFEDFRGDKVRDYMELSMFYGFYPGFFSPDAASDPYWENEKLYGSDRALFQRYMPLILRINRAGWEPVTKVRSSDEAILCERFGELTDGYLSLRNNSESFVQAEIILDINDEKHPVAFDVLNLKELFVSVKGGNPALALDFQPGEIKLIRLLQDNDALLNKALREIETFQIKLMEKYRKYDLVDAGLLNQRIIPVYELISSLDYDYREEWLRTLIESSIISNRLSRPVEARDRDDMVLVPESMLTEDLIVSIRNDYFTGMEDYSFNLVHFYKGEVMELGIGEIASSFRHGYRSINLVLPPDLDREANYFLWIYSKTDERNRFFPLSWIKPVTILPMQSEYIQFGGTSVMPKVKNFSGTSAKVKIMPEFKNGFVTVEPPNVTAVINPDEIQEMEFRFSLSKSGSIEKDIKIPVVLKLIDDNDEVIDSCELSLTILTDKSSKARPSDVVVNADSCYFGYTQEPLNDGVIDVSEVHWSEVAWASQDGAMPHWVEIHFPEPQVIRNVVIYWAIDGGQLYSSAHYRLEYMSENSGWREITTRLDKTVRDMDSLEFEPVRASAIRYYQFKGGGPVSRPHIAWIREIEVF